MQPLPIIPLLFIYQPKTIDNAIALPGDVFPLIDVSNAAASGKVLKINSLIAAGVGNTTGVTVDIYDKATATGAANTVSIASTIAVPTFSSVVIISKENAIYLEEDRSLGVYCQPSAGSINVVVAYEEIS